ncbi:MAG TPA: metallophosphoesterase [Vicinamibacterales bacterium]|jgi:3',5'-cyclic AMP phosphodiesterase CpdA
MCRSCLVLAAAATASIAAQPPLVPEIHAVRPIAPPSAPLPPESATADVSRFAFIVYGDHRCDCSADAANENQTAHAQVVEALLARVKSRALTGRPIRFVVSSGDATFRGQNAERWNNVFTPIVERITQGANLPYFFAPGNHDVTGMPPGDPGRSLGLHNTLTAFAHLIPPEGSPRRLNGYPTFAFGFGNAFFIALDSNIASDTIQLAWVADQLDHLDRRRYRHVFAQFHHPFFSSGPHSGVQATDPVTGHRGPDRVEPATLAMRTLYAPLFRRYHVRMTFAGHEHLFEHFVERYSDGGRMYRRDDLVSGGGGAPIYVYAGEPDTTAYLAGAGADVRVEHLARPGSRTADNPHHFLVVDVDGDRLALEVVSVGAPLAPYGGRSRISLDR